MVPSASMPFGLSAPVSPYATLPLTGNPGASSEGWLLEFNMVIVSSLHTLHRHFKKEFSCNCFIRLLVVNKISFNFADPSLSPNAAHLRSLEQFSQQLIRSQLDQAQQTAQVGRLIENKIISSGWSMIFLRKINATRLLCNYCIQNMR